MRSYHLAGPNAMSDADPALAPHLLLTRPEPGARRFAAALAHLDIAITISPVLQIVPVDHDAQVLQQARGVIFTSAHAVGFAGAGGGRPAICVGPATAAAARAAGYVVTEGPGDAVRMLPLLRDLPPGFVHARGAHVAMTLPVPGVVVYDQCTLPLSPQARALFEATAPVILPLFSPRSATVLAEQIGHPQAPLWLAAISPAALAAWGHRPAARCVVAPTPDAAGMLVAIETAYHGTKPFSAG